VVAALVVLTEVASEQLLLISLRRPSSSLVRLSGQRLPSWWVAWFGARGAGRTAGSRRSPFF